MAPAGTPREVINQVHAAIAESLRDPKVKEVLTATGAEPVGSSPDEFARRLRDEIAKWAKVAKVAGIKPE